MTYAELATALGITAESAQRMVARKKWPRKPGNDGKARIGVPAERLAKKEPVSPDSQEGSPPDRQDGNAIRVTALETEVRMVREMLADRDRQVADLRADRDRWAEVAASLARAQNSPPRALGAHWRAFWRRGGLLTGR